MLRAKQKKKKKKKNMKQYKIKTATMQEDGCVP